jgi:xanthine dehydrogenase accessory factor
MREILPDVEKWLQDDQPVALATVIQTWGSSPRQAGAKMAFTRDGKIVGSVSGGCVENAVFLAGVDVLKQNQAQYLHFGVADETAWGVGLACGGELDVFVQPLEREVYDQLQEEMQAGRALAVATVVQGKPDLVGFQMLIKRDGTPQGSIHPELDRQVIEKAKKAISEGRSQKIKAATGQEEDQEIFIEVMEPQPRLIIVGGVHTAIALTGMAKILGYQTIVIDPRRAFGSPERFPNVDRLIKAWPDEAFEDVEINEKTAIAMLTHDPKIDDPALKVALSSPAFYIGALGSPTTQAKRRQRLLEAGFSKDQIQRLHGPIGMELGSNTPEEIALAIMAEIVAVSHKVMV